MMGWIMFFLACATETVYYLYFFDTFLDHKWLGIRKRLSYVVLYILTTGNAIVVEYFSNEYLIWKIVTLILIVVIYVKICYRSTWVMSGFFSSLALVIELLLGFAMSGMLHNSFWPRIINSFLCILSSFLLCAGVFLLHKQLPVIKQHLRINPDTLMKYTWIPVISVIPGLYFYVFFLQGEWIGYFYVFVAIGLIVVNIALLFYLQDAMIKDEKLRLSEIQNRKNQNQVQTFQDMKALYERQGRKLHDYKKQLATLQELMKSGDVDTAIELTERLTKSIAVEVSEINVGHPVINAVLNQQYRVAKSKGIGMTFAISDLKNVPLPDDDIVVLLGNLLENAVRACEKVIEQGRTASVSVKFVEKDGRIILNVRNPISEKVEIVDNKVVNSSEEGHGIGLSNVESVAEKNDGTFAISCDDKEFSAVVMI